MTKGVEITNKELFEISIKIEQAGQVFYNELVEYISDPMVKDFLLLMARDEADHENLFKKIFGETRGKKFGWENDPALRDLIDKRFRSEIFPKIKTIMEQLPEFDGIKKALEFALQAEELAVEFYGTLRKDCADFETKCLMIGLESEEKAHRDYILRLIKDFGESNLT